MTEILNLILNLIRTNGTLAMILGGFIEQIIVPIPSPIITMAGGAFLIDNPQPFFSSLFQILTRVSLPYSFAATIGTSLVFLLAYFGGRPIIEKFGSKIGVSWKLIEKIRTDFQKSISDELFIFISCIIPVVPVSLISAFCGAFRVPPIKFYPTVLFALIVRSLILGFIGFQMGDTFTSLAHGLGKIESLLTIVGAFLILGFLYLKREKWLKSNS